VRNGSLPGQRLSRFFSSRLLKSKEKSGKFDVEFGLVNPLFDDSEKPRSMKGIHFVRPTGIYFNLNKKVKPDVCRTHHDNNNNNISFFSIQKILAIDM